MGKIKQRAAAPTYLNATIEADDIDDVALSAAMVASTPKERMSMCMHVTHSLLSLLLLPSSVKRCCCCYCCKHSIR